MLNKEDLLAISNLLDVKLEPIKADIVELKEDVSVLKKDVSSLERRVGNLETCMDKLETRMQNLETRMDNLETSVNKLETRMNKLETDVRHLEADVHHVRLTLENSIEPRLQNIENCYISTYKRYSDGADKIDGLQTDVNLLKSVAAEHGQQLSRLASAM